MSNKEIKNLLIILNSAGSFGGKYPIGNKELHAKVLQAEQQGKIRFNNFTARWEKN